MFLPTIAAGGHTKHFIDVDKKCWACGCNRNRKLGKHTGKWNNKNFVFVGDLLPDVQLVSAGMNHTLFLDSDGQVWGCGEAEHQQRYKRPPESPRSPNAPPERIVDRQFPNLGKISLISCGDNFSVALTEEGQVHVMGQIVPIEQILAQPTCMPTSTAIKYLSCGKYHLMFLDVEQQIWGLGSNAAGQLGDPKVKLLQIPQKIENLPEMISVACGGFHTLLLDSEGAVYSCGKNSDGQLGLGDAVDRWTFEKLNFEVSFQQIAGGGLHSLFLDQEGNAYSCGYDNDGQTGIKKEQVGIPIPDKEALRKKLKIPDKVEAAYQVEMLKYQEASVMLTKMHYSPRKISIGNPILLICAGYLHSLFVDISGYLWSCGYNDMGQLGTGDCEKREIPTKIGDFTILTILREQTVVKNARKY